MIIGNKVDLADARKVSTSNAKRVCEENGNMLFFEASAKANTNVEDAFKQLGQKAVKR